MPAIELLCPGEATPENARWHKLRRGGITASEIAAVLGISPPLSQPTVSHHLTLLRETGLLDDRWPQSVRQQSRSTFHLHRVNRPAFAELAWALDPGVLHD